MQESRSQDTALLEKFHQLIEEHLGDEDLSVDRLARFLGLSRSGLHRKLIQLTGRSASSLIHEHRMRRAKDSLENSSLTIAEISYQLGYSSPSYFCKVFKKHFGKSPGELRRKHILNRDIPGLKDLITRNSKWVILTVAVTLVGILVFLFMPGRLSSHNSSIAVLPFDNLDGNEQTQFFADGLVDNLLGKLSFIDELKVISRISSEVYREKGEKTIPKIAKELGVSFILEGSIQVQGNRLRIHTQLIDAAQDDHVWANSYDRSIEDFFQTQSEIALTVAAELNKVLTQQQVERIRRIQTNDIKAYGQYQLGRITESQRTKPAFLRSIDCYEQSIALDSGFALAYAGLADNYQCMALQGHIDRQEGAAMARKMVQKALDLNPNLAEAMVVHASIRGYFDYQWDEGIEILKEAIRIKPNYPTAYQYLGELLFITGQYKGAMKNVDRALELNPFSLVTRMVRCRYLFLLGLYEEAFIENEKCLRQDPLHPWNLIMQMFVSYKLGLDQELLQAAKQHAAFHHDFDPSTILESFLEEGALGIVKLELSHKTVGKWNFCWYALLEDYDMAFAELYQLMEEGQAISHSWIAIMNAVKDDPRYAKLALYMGIAL